MIKRLVTGTIAFLSVFVFMSLTTEHNFFKDNLPELFISYFVYIAVYMFFVYLDKKIRKKT
ncbi:hypothetical protein L21SP5_02531 [Salinivirga cyanobacteriivorans]|uniref:Uncharacterized protein n=1 Tax=Salinivirga cyanobacteriivorans TaxID=1307839 RepID=A0A0S2I1K9_9BACT|nr:hypothetical protein [Salinivirga cyanobacteriivorans]ALO16155.1 hypothetical protein L21SP5_02531 [Salinivirga cyanobacteriivorans]